MSLIEEKQSLLRSPCCWAGLRLDPTDMRDSRNIAWEGEWICANCGRTFPHRRGVAFLSIIDRDWLTTIGEQIARRKIFQRTLDGETIPAERQSEHDAQNTSVLTTMDTLFNAALGIIQPRAGMQILDVGAGMCRTSAEFARRGASVVAAETEPSNLLYASFAETNPDSPSQIQIHGQTFHEFNPERFPKYFSRVVAPAHRLPFAEATFDVVFCRSVLHHFHDLGRALREMLRVLKPGGLLCACSEPTRSVFDSEDSHLIGGIDKEEGFNEQVPTLIDYWRALVRNTNGVRVQAWSNPHQFRSKRIFDWVPYNYHRHLRHGEVVRGIKLLKLLPVSTGSNIYARRNLYPIPSPHGSADLLPDFTARELATINTPPTLEASVARFGEDTGALANARLRMIGQVAPPPATFIPGLCRERELQIGWRKRVRKAGAIARFTNRTAEVTLSIPPGGEKLQILCAAPTSMADATGNAEIAATVRVNGSEVGEVSIAPAHGWRTVLFAVPNRGSQVCDVEIRTAALTRSLDEGQPSELGIAFQWMRIL